MSQIAYQPNAYQTNTFQAGIGIPAFQNNAFQFDSLAFQMEASPIPPTPVYDGHDGGRKKALKKLKELEDKRIQWMRQDAEQRKMLLRHAFDPAEKAAYEARMAKLSQQDQPAQPAKEIAKIDNQMARLQTLKQNANIQAYLRAELSRIHTERAMREHEIRMQVQEAEDEIALMMMM